MASPAWWWPGGRASSIATSCALRSIATLTRETSRSPLRRASGTGLAIPSGSPSDHHEASRELVMTDVVIVSAARTPVGSFNGAFGSLTAHELGALAIKGALERANVAPEDVDEVILGQVLAGGEGQNPARQAAMAAGVPQEKTAWGMNQLCGSGLRSVALGLQQIANGDAKVIVAGGMESMSMAPHLSHLRSGTKMGDVKFIDSMLKDGLMDAFHGYHMGVTAENIASKWQISRDEQDAFATNSQNKAEDAQQAGRFTDE